MKRQEAIERFGEMFLWYGTHETDSERSRRAIGKSRQYMARYAEYAWHRNPTTGKVSDNVVEVTIYTARHNKVASTTIHKKVFNNRPTGRQSEIRWAHQCCDITEPHPQEPPCPTCSLPTSAPRVPPQKSRPL